MFEFFATGGGDVAFCGDLTDHVFHFDALDELGWEFDFEACGGVVDVVSESAFHGGVVTDEIHGGTGDAMPRSN